MCLLMFLDEWSEESITLLQSLAASPMIMNVIEAPPGEVIRVDLTPRSQGASVADTLVAEKCAQRRMYNWCLLLIGPGSGGDLSMGEIPVQAIFMDTTSSAMKHCPCVCRLVRRLSA